MLKTRESRVRLALVCIGLTAFGLMLAIEVVTDDQPVRIARSAGRRSPDGAPRRHGRGVRAARHADAVPARREAEPDPGPRSGARRGRSVAPGGPPARGGTGRRDRRAVRELGPHGGRARDRTPHAQGLVAQGDRDRCAGPAMRPSDIRRRRSTRRPASRAAPRSALSSSRISCRERGRSTERRRPSQPLARSRCRRTLGRANPDAARLLGDPLRGPYDDHDRAHMEARASDITSVGWREATLRIGNTARGRLHSRPARLPSRRRDEMKSKDMMHEAHGVR